MTLNEWSKRCKDAAAEKGFDHRSDDEGMIVSIALVITELSEAIEAIRNGKYRKIGEWEKDTFEDEIADSMIRLFHISGALGINLDWQVEKKLEYNKSRPLKHGKKL